MAEINTRTVWVVQNDTRKDFNEARQYGELKSLFPGNPGRYDGDKFVTYVRDKLEKSYQPGDYILVVGDPTLVAIVCAVALELDGTLTLLRWDREKYTYKPFEVNFYGIDAIPSNLTEEVEEDFKFNR